MSSGRSSQEVACFSVERTKYLMFSKSIRDRSAPQEGIGFLSKSFSALSRVLTIHSGSDFFSAMSRTTSSFRPRRAEAPASSGSAQPYSYVPSPSSSGCAIDVITRILLDSDVLLVSPAVGGGLAGLGGTAGLDVSGCHVGGADAVAVGDGRQPPHRGAEQAREGLHLRLAQLRELRRHVPHRAVVLAQLLAAAGRGRLGRGSRVAVVGQRLGELAHPRLRGHALQERPVAGLQLGDLAPRELGDRPRSG